ncbi:MAG: type II toxin-antitoxin system YafQ family toxin [Bacteroidales bacterium]|nr:type II toxin-antitoxin system YafQ family toxin [Bacteroidales bacterium]
MKKLKPSTQYKKDLKKIRNNPKKVAELLTILRMLENEMAIPDKYHPHMLIGDYEGCMECHIQGDFLLIWIDAERNEIDLVRLGSHSDLFGKGFKR